MALIEFIVLLDGTPIDVPKIEEPTQEQVDEVHAKLMTQLVDLFEKHKHLYLQDPENAKLIIL